MYKFFTKFRDETGSAFFSFKGWTLPQPHPNLSLVTQKKKMKNKKSFSFFWCYSCCYPSLKLCLVWLSTFNLNYYSTCDPPLVRFKQKLLPILFIILIYVIYIYIYINAVNTISRYRSLDGWEAIVGYTFCFFPRACDCVFYFACFKGHSVSPVRVQSISMCPLSPFSGKEKPNNRFSAHQQTSHTFLIVFFCLFLFLFFK